MRKQGWLPWPRVPRRQAPAEFLPGASSGRRGAAGPRPSNGLTMGFLFPAEPRNFAGQRWVRITLRTAHLIAMAFLVGGVAQGSPIEELLWALWGTFVSGLLFIALEVFNTGLWLFQIKGIAVLLKVLLMAVAVATPQSAMPLLVTAIVIGGISSHMPGKYRNYSILHGRVIKP